MLCYYCSSVATSGGGGFGKQRLLFATRTVRCFSSLGRLNDCECTNTLAPNLYLYLYLYPNLTAVS